MYETKFLPTRLTMYLFHFVCIFDTQLSDPNNSVVLNKLVPGIFFSPYILVKMHVFMKKSAQNTYWLDFFC